MSNYSSQLRDPRWQRKRLEIMKRDGFTCIACGNKNATLTVHHKKYAKTLWDVPDEELQTLCEGCHEALGPHPKGGIWWTGAFNGYEGVGWSCSHCPMCGNNKHFKDKGSYDKCMECGYRILPEKWPDEIKEFNRSFHPWQVIKDVHLLESDMPNLATHCEQSECGYSMYKDILIQWDEDHDERILIMIKNLPEGTSVRLIAIQEHEGALGLIWKDDVPDGWNTSDNNAGVVVDVGGSNRKYGDWWCINSSIALQSLPPEATCKSEGETIPVISTEEAEKIIDKCNSDTLEQLKSSEVQI